MHDKQLKYVIFGLQRGKQFAETSTRARQSIAELGARFVRHDAVVMVHGFSRVALALLHQVAQNVSACPTKHILPTKRCILPCHVMNLLHPCMRCHDLAASFQATSWSTKLTGDICCPELCCDLPVTAAALG